MADEILIGVSKSPPATRLEIKKGMGDWETLVDYGDIPKDRAALLLQFAKYRCEWHKLSVQLRIVFT